MRIDYKKLTNVRRNKQLSIKCVANHISIPPVYLACIENGRRPLLSDSEVAKALISLYGISLEDIT